MSTLAPVYLIIGVVWAAYDWHHSEKMLRQEVDAPTVPRPVFLASLVLLIPLIIVTWPIGMIRYAVRAVKARR